MGFVDNFLIDIAVFREILLEAFLKPLIDAVSLYSLPTEIVLKIWHLTQPNLTLPVVWVNLVEARKFLLLLKTTTLAVYNAALKGKIILYSQLIISRTIHIMYSQKLDIIHIFI